MQGSVGHSKDFGFDSKIESLEGFQAKKDAIQLNFEKITLAVVWRMDWKIQEWKQRSISKLLSLSRQESDDNEGCDRGSSK